MSTAVFRTVDGVEYVVPCEGDNLLLDAAQAVGHGLQSLCRRGECGVCRAKLVSGHVTLDTHSTDALSVADEAAGSILLCRSHADTDIVVDLPYDSSRVLSGAVLVRQVTIAELDHWAGGIVRMLVRAVDDPDLGTAIQFDSGQFAELMPPDGAHSRAYSFASVANWDGTAEFYVKLRPGGYFSEYLRTQAKVGDRLTMRGPQGTFGLRENGSRPRWMVCGGTGLAPIMSMLRRMAEWGDTQDAVLILGVNRPAEVYATQEMADLSASMPALRTFVAVVQPDSAWTGPVGNAVDVMNAQLDALADGAEKPDIYLCGPPPFLDAAHVGAESRGVPADQIYEERIVLS